MNNFDGVGTIHITLTQLLDLSASKSSWIKEHFESVLIDAIKNGVRVVVTDIDGNSRDMGINESGGLHIVGS